MLWDIFCKVIDNFGDIGVCWRLSADLASRGEQVRLWVDDASALAWMAPDGCEGVTVLAWTAPFDDHGLLFGDVLIEAFGCDLPPEVVERHAQRRDTNAPPPVWINLEYLSAEPFAARSHGLPSPVMRGGKAFTKYFFYPGFEAGTGGLLRETDQADRQAAFDRTKWLSLHGIAVQGERLISLFCYEPPALISLLQSLANDPLPTRLLVTYGRAVSAVSTAISQLDAAQPNWNLSNSLRMSFLPALTQPGFDNLLWACDLNFVRGEDSLVRAIWAGKPFVWQIYPQHDNAHHVKLEAFLEAADAPASLRRFHRVWNGLEHGNLNAELSTKLNADLPAPDFANWAESALAAKTRLLAQDSLTKQLIQFATKKR